MTSPRVTAIRYDPEALGREAALLVLAQLGHIGGGATVRRIEIPTELVLRDSVGPPPPVGLTLGI